MIAAVYRTIYTGPNRSFLVLGRREIRDPFADQPHIVISISGPRDPLPEIYPSAHCRGILRLCFDDVKTAADPRFQAFHPRDARAIVEFVQAHPDVLIVCQCEAGICRSAAVAAGLSRWLNGSGHEAWFVEHYIPNPLVLEGLTAYVERYAEQD